MQKVIVYHPRLGWEHLGPLPESILVIFTTRAPTETGPSWDPHAQIDRSDRLSGPTTPTRPDVLRSIHPLSWLAKAADLELAAGRLRLLRAAARRLLVVDHSLLGKHAVVSGLGLDMGHGRWSRWFVVVG